MTKAKTISVRIDTSRVARMMMQVPGPYRTTSHLVRYAIDRLLDDSRLSVR